MPLHYSYTTSQKMWIEVTVTISFAYLCMCYCGVLDYAYVTHQKPVTAQATSYRCRKIITELSTTCNAVIRDAYSKGTPSMSVTCMLHVYSAWMLQLHCISPMYITPKCPFIALLSPFQSDICCIGRNTYFVRKVQKLIRLFPWA